MLKHKLRRYAAAKLKPYMRYTSYGIDEREFLFRYNGSLDEFVQLLNEHGYHYQLFAAIKDVKHVSSKTDLSDTNQTGRIEDNGSYARIPDEHPSAVTDTALEDISPRECQFHVHPFVKDGHIDVYGHYEIHPYPWTPTLDIGRSKRHYNPTYGDTYLKGVVDPQLSLGDI